MLSHGDKVGPYTIRETAGQGGMATVYKAWHEGLHRFEALKVPRGAESHGHAPDNAYIQRLLAEARVAAGLHHPHIVAIHGVSEPLSPIPFFAMDWVEGRDLAKILTEKRAFSIAETIQILEPVASALDYAHEHGVVHRDIKPANILITDKNGVFVPRVVDFGISRAAEDEDGATKLTKSGMIVGTPEYMSPEQAGSGEVVDYRTDIYSLAVVAFEMLCGGPPFTAGSGVSRLSILIAHVRDTAPLFEKYPDFPRAAGEALLRALSKTPAERPKSCELFLAEFKAALSQSEGVFRADDADLERLAANSGRHETRDEATLLAKSPLLSRVPATLSSARGGAQTGTSSSAASGLQTPPSTYSLRARLEAASLEAASGSPSMPSDLPVGSARAINLSPAQSAVAPSITATPTMPQPAAPGQSVSAEKPAVSPENITATKITPTNAAPEKVTPISASILKRSTSRIAFLTGTGGICAAALAFVLLWRVFHAQNETSAPKNLDNRGVASMAASTKPTSTKPTSALPKSEKPVVAAPRLRTVRQIRRRAIPFSTLVKKSASRLEGSRVVTRRGEIGVREIVFKITYRGDKEMTRRVESQRVTHEPTSQIVVIGIRQEPAAASREAFQSPTRPVKTARSFEAAPSTAPRRRVRRLSRATRAPHLSSRPVTRVVNRQAISPPRTRASQAVPRLRRVSPVVTRRIREAPLPP